MRTSSTFCKYLFFLAAIAFCGCRNKKDVDVSNIKLNVKVQRFDKDLNSLNLRNLPHGTAELKSKYGVFYEDYMERILQVGSTADTGYFSNLRTVLTNQDYKALNTEVQKVFPDLTNTEKQLTDAFKHIKYYYPKQKVPKLISYLSGFAVQTPIGNDYVGIGLDMFLGADSKFYPALVESIPVYISRRFAPEYITPRVVESVARENMFPEPDRSKSLLSKMIYNGKILYFMDAVMPDVADSVKMGYTSEQIKWCEEFEPEIWGYFLENNLLYETDYMKIQMYLTEAPFTPGLGEKNDSAPKLGVWLGWQIVKKFMDKNPEITLQQLMQEQDSQKILNLSKYKPK